MLCHVIDHLSLQVADVDAAAALYLRLFAPLGIKEVMRFPRDGELVIGLGGPDGVPKFWLGPAGGLPTREVHVAFSAADRAAVDAVHAAALEAGVEVLHPPKEWPQYHPGYYGVFVRDLDGNNVEAVCHAEPVTGDNRA
jgi:catechol 2,3-dioxygenase-like lactoylglutathione lyase family enzyme